MTIYTNLHHGHDEGCVGFCHGCDGSLTSITLKIGLWLGMSVYSHQTVNECMLILMFKYDHASHRLLG